jgi:putative peptidoglycan lipid II flippase
MTMISRVLGFVRDMLIARIFGADAGTDAFLVAFKIPNFLRRLFAEGAFSQAFVPLLSEYKEQQDQAAVKALVDKTAGTLGVVLFLVSLLGVIAAPLLIMLFAPGFVDDPQKHGLAADMLRLTFPYLLFISLTALAGGVLNTYGKFGVPAFTPVFLNLSLIGCAVWLAPHMDEPVTALAWGVLIAGVLQLLFQLPFLAKLGFCGWPRWGWKDSGVRRIIKLMGPAILGVSVVQINLLLDTIIASFLVTGSVSWLYFSDRLVEFPLGVFGIALATVVLPSLSKQHARADVGEFSQTMDWALRWVILIGVPATLGLLLLAGPMLATLFYYGEFGRHDLEMASLSLMAYSLGLLGFIMVKVLAPGFYARQDTKTPVKVAVKAMVANMVLNIAFVVPMVWLDVPGAHAGLALATALAAFVNAGLLFYLLRKEGAYQPQAGWGAFGLRVVVAAAAMSLVLLFGVQDIVEWTQWRGWVRAGWMLAWVAAGAGAYFATLFLLGVKPRDVLGKRKVSETPE